jgi:integrase
MHPQRRTGGRPGAVVTKPWFVQYRLPDGTQKSPGFRTRAEAQAFCDAHGARLRSMRGLVPLVRSDISTAEYATRWLADIRQTIKPRTLATYASQLRLYVTPRLGPRPVAELTRPELKAFLVACREAGVRGAPLKTGAVYAIYATVRALLNAAIEDGLRGDNPAARLGKRLHLHPTAAARRAAILARALDREQTAQVLELARTKRPAWYPFVLLLVRTGLRLGEALALRLADYNATARTLKIERAWDARHCVEGPPKHGARVVDVSPELAAVLDAHVAGLSKVVGLDGVPVIPFLFPSLERTRLEGRNVRRALKRLAKAAGLGRTLKPHDLRHTYASQLIAAGISPVYVQRQLGHASLQTTVDLYGSGLPMADTQAVAVLDTAVPPDGGTVVVREPSRSRGRLRT